MPLTKGSLTPKEIREKELDIAKEFLLAKEDTKFDLQRRVNGVPAQMGGGGYQFAGYTTLERFYRGDQWNAPEPPGAAQRTDNYCAVIVDNLSSLIFDDDPDVSAPTDDPSDDLLEIKAETKEALVVRVWRDNNSRVEFDELSKGGSLYGDSFIKGPYMEKDKKNGDKWKIKFHHIEDPASVRVVWADGRFKDIGAFIEETRYSLSRALLLYGDAARAKGIDLMKEAKVDGLREGRVDYDTRIPMVTIAEMWTDERMSLHVNDKTLDFYFHNWKFVPLIHIKNSYVPNYPYGKSDLEDVLDPQLAHNRTMNDLANFLRWVSTVNMWGKNLEGMEALVAGMSRIYSLPDDGELHAFEKTGDPYIANTFVQQRRAAIIDIAGISEAMLSSSQTSVASGRALALAFQGTLRKLGPRMKRYEAALEQLNENILRLYEIYFPKTKMVIEGDYRTEVRLSATLLRNIVDTINKLQSGIISLDTAQKEAGVARPRMEQKVMRKNLQDPLLGPQMARQPALLPQLQEGQNQPGEQPTPGPGQRFSSPGGAPAAANQQASGAAPTPVTE